MKYQLLLIALFLSFYRVYGQPYYFNHYQTEDGLSNNTVLCSLQDSNGFMWFGTKDGLNRFDGYNFKIYRNDTNATNRIGNNIIVSLFEDARKVLWVGTDRGLYQYNEMKDNFTLLKNTADSMISNIKQDSAGNIWFVRNLSLCSYHPEKKQFKVYYQLNGQAISAVCVTKDGQLWIATREGVLKKYDLKNQKFITCFSLRKFSAGRAVSLTKLCDSGSGKLLIGTKEQGVIEFNANTGQCRNIIATEVFVRDILQHNADEFWIGTENGIYIYHQRSGLVENIRKKLYDTYSLSDNAIYTLCNDKEGGIWMGTYFGGVNYYPKQYALFEKDYPQVGGNSLSGTVVREIVADQYHNLWLGTEDGGLNRLSLSKHIFTNIGPKNIYNNIHGLMITGDTLWVGTFAHGLGLMNVRTGHFFRHFTAGHGVFKTNFIYSIARSGKDTLLLCSSRGIYVYCLSTKKFSVLKDVPEIRFYTSTFTDSKGMTWIGTLKNGIYCIDLKKHQYRHFSAVNDRALSPFSGRINSFFEDSRERLWITSDIGLFRYLPEENTFRAYSTANGLPCNLIYSILEDSFKNLWISTSKGLVNFNPETESVSAYTMANGLLYNQFNYNSAYQDKNGKMYFGCVKGLINFRPGSFIRNTFMPPVFITGFQVFDKELKIGGNGPLKKSILFTDTVTLPYSQSTFSLDFAALSYTSPTSTKYAYSMAGLDNQWNVMTTNRKIYFTKLNPGHYRISIKAANNSGVWSAHVAHLTILVLPPWWSTKLAYTGYLFLLLISGFLVFRTYKKKTTEKIRRQMAILESEKEKEIYKAKIEFFTHIAHEIRTPLTLIQGPIENIIDEVDDRPAVKKSLQTIKRNTDRLLSLTGKLLDFRKTEIQNFSLNFYKTNVTKLVKDQYESFQSFAVSKDLNFSIHIPKSPYYAYIDPEVVNKILSNLLDNAVKYAKSSVSLSCNFPENEDFFSIRVKNDGYLIPFEMKDKIFETFYRLKETDKKRGSGIGLALSKSLTELQKGTLILEFSEPGLNVFCLMLPVQQAIKFDLKS